MDFSFASDACRSSDSSWRARLGGTGVEEYYEAEDDYEDAQPVTCVTKTNSKSSKEVCRKGNKSSSSSSRKHRHK